MKTNPNSKEFFEGYSKKLQEVLQKADWSPIEELAADMKKCWNDGHRVFLCGNGGSAGNAIHLANDFIYGIAKKTGGGLRAISLSDNSAVITCLANDVGYEHIYSEQLAVQAEKGDLLITLSGSGNSPNILLAVEQAKKMQIKSFAVLGYSGGKCKEIVDVPIHFAIDDMQIAEDLQIIVGHMLMQWLYINRPEK